MENRINETKEEKVFCEGFGENQKEQRENIFCEGSREKQAEGQSESCKGRGAGDKKAYYAISKKGIALATCACILFSGLFGFGGACAANYISDKYIAEKQEAGNRGYGEESPVISTMNLEKATGSELSIQEIIALNGNAVVEIRTETVTTDSLMMQYITEGAGSGVIISGDGYIITNNHVIDGANKITVILKNGTEYEARLIGRDSETDVAVVKIEDTGLTAAVFGDSDKLVQGELAVAIGNPLGRLGGTATAGIISALDREITINGKQMTLLQTDASINPGNSGGGLFNQYGELIGIVVAKSTGSDVEGLGFAIPINTASAVANEIIENGYVAGRADVGMSFLDITSIRSAFYYGVRNLGIYVNEVYGDEAKEAGFRTGDMICYVGEKAITSADELTEAFGQYNVGDTAYVTVLRDNARLTLKLVIGEKTS